MTSDDLKKARTTVERAAKQAQEEESERTAGWPTRVAVRRVASLRRRSGIARFVYENGLSLAATALFLVSFVGQVMTGRAHYNAEQQAHGDPSVSVTEYLRTGAFVEATAENWESEFLQMAIFVLLTAFLYQRGSSESKQIEAPEAVDQKPEAARGKPDVPWPVRKGGIALAFYKHSLSLALFALFAASFALHAAGGAADYNNEQRQHGEATVSVLGYLATSRFWFESFQNWQSEFLSVAVLVLLTIWLREQGSPQSKPVAAPASETGE